MSEDKVNFEQNPESEANLRQNIRKWRKVWQKCHKMKTYIIAMVFSPGGFLWKHTDIPWRNQGEQDSLFSVNPN